MKKLFAISMTINALLIGLLVAQTAQAKVKTYDAVKLAEYSACLHSIAVRSDGAYLFSKRDSQDPRVSCNWFRPKP